MKTDTEQVYAALVIAGMLEGIPVNEAEEILAMAAGFIKNLTPVNTTGGFAQGVAERWNASGLSSVPPQKCNHLLNSGLSLASEFLWSVQE